MGSSVAVDAIQSQIDLLWPMLDQHGAAAIEFPLAGNRGHKLGARLDLVAEILGTARGRRSFDVVDYLVVVGRGVRLMAAQEAMSGLKVLLTVRCPVPRHEDSLWLAPQPVWCVEDPHAVTGLRRGGAELAAALRVACGEGYRPLFDLLPGYGDQGRGFQGWHSLLVCGEPDLLLFTGLLRAVDARRIYHEFLRGGWEGLAGRLLKTPMQDPRQVVVGLSRLLRALGVAAHIDEQIFGSPGLVEALIYDAMVKLDAADIVTELDDVTGVEGHRQAAVQ